MPRRNRLLVIAFVLLNAACGGDDSSGRTAAGPDAPDQVRGPVISVDSQGLGKVRSFDVKNGDRIYEIRIDPSVDYGFPLDHLNEHRISGDPVIVRLEERGGELYALYIEDAPVE
jgi:hypothetical protein